MMRLSVALVLFAVVDLTVFAACIWPPLALLPAGVAALAAGLLIDWEKLRGQPSSPAQRTR